MCMYVYGVGVGMTEEERSRCYSNNEETLPPREKHFFLSEHVHTSYYNADNMYRITAAETGEAVNCFFL